MSRLKYRVSLFDIDGKTPFQLLKQLRKFGSLDVDVCVGAKQKLPVRVVAQKLPEKIAAERRRKAKNHRDRRRNPSKESLMLLGWEIFICNVSRDTWSPKDVCEIYGIRWRIEIVFKAWKSHFHMGDIPKGNSLRVLSYVYSALILVTLFHSMIFKNLSLKAEKKSIGFISILKLSQFFKEQLWAMALLVQKDFLNTVLNQIVYHCIHEKRRNRTFYPEIISSLG